jgi:multiple sugar transport system substrate-binding protein
MTTKKQEVVMKKSVLLVLVALSLLAAPLFAAGQAEAESEEVTITWGNWQFLETGRDVILEGFIDDFEAANPGIKVEPVPIAYSSYNDALTTQFRAGKGPDVIRVQDMTLVPWMKMGFLAPLNDLIDLDKYADEFPAQQSLAELNGETLAIICEGFPYGALMINGELLEASGMDVPTTPEELLAVSDAIYEATGFTGLAHATEFANQSYIMQSGMIVVEGFGGRIVKDGEFAVNDADFVAGVEFLVDIYNLKSHPAGMQFGLQREQFLSGEAGMVMDGSYWPGIVRANNEELYENLIVAKLPFPDPATEFETNWDAINANSSPEKQEAAAKFIEFLMSEEVASKWALESAIPGLNFTARAISEEYPWFEVFAEAAPHAVVRPIPGYEADTPEIRKMVADGISYAMSGEVTAQQAMDQLKKDLDQRFN